ncbi:MAG: hypothetical protein SCH71_07170 [Desulfobulbaceae bacterium]|nr:hypothetical protein [Desulfobulbaceae bacterium]
MVFLILLYNGGLIEQIADSWWHLSLANKIGMFNSLDVNNHLLGTPDRYYPPLWHANLAMLHKVSDISLPILWNAFTAWGGSFKVMGFYLLALGLSRNANIAILSAVLFVFLPGLGNSYLRVSAWPSHISYTAWFCLFYVTFALMDKTGMSVFPGHNNSILSFWNRCLINVWKNFILVISFIVLAIIVLFTHQAELLWFACGILFYAMGLSCYQLLQSSTEPFIEPGGGLLRPYLVGCLLGIMAATWFTYSPVLADLHGLSDLHGAVLLPVVPVLFFLYVQTEKSPLAGVYNANTAKILFFVMLAITALSIDQRQLVSLFMPELGYPLPGYYDAPLHGTGWLGDRLELPGWHMQLRNGLLYSGVLAIGISVVMAVIKPSRGTIFLAANAVIPFLFLVSPYLYQWLSDVLSYLSSWRIALLIFHPIILAFFLHYLWQVISQEVKGRDRIIAFTGNSGSDSAGESADREHRDVQL